jgi:hypothetical protein
MSDKNAPEPLAPAPLAPAPMDMQAWAYEAAAKAKANATSRTEHGAVVDADPRLSYSVIDGDASAPIQARQRAFLEARGYRHIPDAKVLGYRNPVVMAIPAQVHRDVLRAQRVDETRVRMKRWGATLMVMNPTEYS